MAQAADPLGFFDEPTGPSAQAARNRSRRSDGSASRSPAGKRSEARSRSDSQDRRRRSPSSAGGGGDSLEARVRRLRKRIDDFVYKNRLDSRVSGIMQNMHPQDAVKVMEVAFPEDCRNPSGFVVAQIRRIERDVGRPKDYRWDQKNWDEGPKDFGTRPRSKPGADRGGNRRSDAGRSPRGRVRQRARSRSGPRRTIGKEARRRGPRGHGRDRGRRRERSPSCAESYYSYEDECGEDDSKSASTKRGGKRGRR